MAQLIEAVWVRSAAEWTAAQRDAAHEGCREYLRWIHPGEEPGEPDIEAFLSRAMESTLSACWWFSGENGTGAQPGNLLEAMRRHCEPVGLSVSGHLSC